MGVYLPNMEMPKSCHDCEMSALVDVSDGLSYGCQALKEMIFNDRERLPNCPLVPVPPHYDLIDHNALKIAVMDCDAETRIDFLKHAMDCINKAPVVIPSDMPTYEAEEGET